MNNEVLTQVLLMLLGIAGTIITGVLIPYLRSKTTKEQREDAEYWTGKAVEAIEEFYRNKGQEKMGPIKKEFVIDFMKKSGSKLTEEQLGVLIDALVKKLINNPVKEFFEE